MHSLQRHFLEVHNVKIRPKSLGVEFGSGEILPMSHCETTGYQIYKKHPPPDMMSTILAFSTSRPAERLRKIQQGWNVSIPMWPLILCKVSDCAPECQLLQYDSSDFVSGAGIRISPDPLSVHARILPSQFIDFGGQVRQKIEVPIYQIVASFCLWTVIPLQKPGEWDVKNRRLYEPVSINRWVVINLTGEYGRVQNIRAFINALGMAMKNRGEKVSLLMVSILMTST